MAARPLLQRTKSVIDWLYDCERCGTVLDTNLRIVSSVEVWRWPPTPAAWEKHIKPKGRIRHS